VQDYETYTEPAVQAADQKLQWLEQQWPCPLREPTQESGASAPPHQSKGAVLVRRGYPRESLAQEPMGRSAGASAQV